MAMSIKQIHPIFVGEVTGVDLARPLTREEARGLEQAMDTYAVLVFHDQPLTDAQQQAFRATSVNSRMPKAATSPSRRIAAFKWV